MHALYNHKLKKMSEHLRLNFIDDFSPLVGNQGVVAEEFVPGHPGNDHHLGHYYIGSVIVPLIASHVKQNGHLDEQMASDVVK